jgi:redox-sensitive bicupin YhaK (pirin superfamily)
MNSQVEKTGREAILVEDAARIRMMGFPVLEALPSRSVPYVQVDPFILLHEARLRLSDLANVDTKHPHRGFDNICYVIEGSASTSHSTGPGGAMERARLRKGALLVLRTGRGVWHAEAIGADGVGECLAETEFRSVLFWVNLAPTGIRTQSLPHAFTGCSSRPRPALSGPFAAHLASSL